MSAYGEQTFIQHLTDDDSISVIVRENLAPEMLPTEELRPVYEWAVETYFRGGRVKAPSVSAMLNEWGDLLSDFEIDIEEEPEDTIEYAIDDLRGSFVYKEVQSFNKRLAQAMADANTHERLEIIRDFSTDFVALSVAMESKDSMVDVREGMRDRLDAYDRRAADRESFYGLRFGLDQIDEYTRGIHPGELAVLAAGPKVGKSYFLARVALKEWEAGRTVVLYTLENDIRMTQDRIISLALGLESRAWQHGTETEENRERAEYWTAVQAEQAEFPFYLIQPSGGQRTVEALVRRAQMLEADSLLIDQLTFLEAKDERAPRHIQIRELTHDLKTMISMDRDRMPCLLAHQINREGVKMADKEGHLEMYHFAEGSEVERTADWAFGLHRSEAERASLKAKFQTLAARREDPRHFMLTWSIDTGYVNVRHQLDLETGREIV